MNFSPPSWLNAPQHRWLGHLSEEDLSFLRRFLLASGSLKAVAKAYDVSYPTVRLRLDRLIAKVQVIEEQGSDDEFEQTLRIHYVEGRLDDVLLRELLEAHRQALARHGGTP